MTPTQIRTAQAILNIFETGSVLGDYGMVTVIRGDTGHLTFGRSQTTLGSGNLYRLLKQYADNPGARFGQRMQAWLPRVQAGDITLDHDRRLHNLLRATADDPVMRETQDAFFDEVYWQPAHRAAQRLGVTSPLGTAVVYDGHVHGSWARMRDRTDEQAGTVATIGEQAWVQAYVHTRREWLANHTREDLRRTVYRMDAFQRLLDLGQWGLDLPLVVRGREISAATLNAAPPGCYDGPAPASRTLAVQSPLLRGRDVRLLQLALSDRGIDVVADGMYGNGSEQAVRAHQQANNLPVTGVATPEYIAGLINA